MYKVLLADDVKLALAAAKGWLEGRNLTVIATTSAAEAKDLSSVINPDLIILDFELSEMTGAELCQWLKADPQTAHVPVLILSAHDDQDTVRQCEQAGASGFIHKSKGREALLDNVARILGVPRRRNVRVPCRFTVGLTDGSGVLAGTLHDISFSGVFLTAPTRFSLGTPLHLRFALPDLGTEIEVLGEVVRIENTTDEGPGCGVQFLETDERSRQALQEFVEKTI
jgi:uncharacterized protein (TIGR02266 family)